MLKKCLFFFLLIFFFLNDSNCFSSEIELEEVLVDVKINRFQSPDMISAYFSPEKMDPLISIEEILRLFDVNNYTFEKNILSFQMSGKEKKVNINITQIYEEESLVEIREIEKFFKESTVKWDISTMGIVIETKETLEWEFLKEQELKRKKLDRKTDEDSVKIYEDRWSIFTLGKTDVSYYKTNIDDRSGNSLYLNSTNQFLWGSLKSNISITDQKSKLDSIYWERDLYEGRKISVGDGYNSLPFSLRTENAFTGINIYSKNSWDQGLNIDKNSIRGHAQNGLMVELYRNGILESYQLSRNSEFNFQVESLNGLNKYEVWIYHSDGEIEKKKISLYGDSKFLKKNKFDYELKLGQSKGNSDFKPYNVKVIYGLTDEITLGINSYNLEYENKMFNNYSLLYKFQVLDDWTGVMEGNYSSNLKDSKENMYRFEFRSGNNFFHNTLGIENYKNLDRKLLSSGDDQNFYNRSTFSIFSFFTTLFIENNKNYSQGINNDTYGVGVSRSFFQNYISTNMNCSKSYYSNKKTKQNIDLSVSYNIKNEKIKKYLNTFSVRYSTEYKEKKYEVMLGKSRKINENFDYYLNLEKNNFEIRAGLTFNYKFGNKFSLRSSSNWQSKNTNTNTSIGGRVSMDFNSPDLLTDPDDYGDSSVKGVIYVDFNDNGILDDGDGRVEGIMLSNSSHKVITDENGKYYFANMTSRNVQEFKMKILNEEYLMGYKLSKKIKFKTLPGGSLEINVPLQQIKTLVGMIEFDESFYLEEVKTMLKDMSVKITNVDTNKVEVIKVEDENFIKSIRVGRYLVEVLLDGEKIKVENKLFTIQSGEEMEKYLEMNISKSNDGYVISIDQS